MKLTIYSEPLNDNSMVFNTKTKKYELTIQEVKANFEIPFTDDGVLEARIKKNSRAVYGYIYAMGAPCNKRLVDYILHHTEEGRQYIYDALISQIEADLTSGFNSLIDQPRIDLKTGRVISEEDMVLSFVSVPTRQILENSEAYCHLNLLYRGLFPSYYWRNIINE